MGPNNNAETPGICQPRKLENKDLVDGFQSGVDELDTWLTRFAKVNQRANNAVTYVTATDDRRVVGFYAITVAGVGKKKVPSEIAGDSPPVDVPCLLLARLAVDWEYQGKGIGQGLFTDSLKRAVMLSQAVGIRAFLIHALDEAARDFYMKYANCVQSPTDPLHLMISIHAIERALRESLTVDLAKASPGNEGQ